MLLASVSFPLPPPPLPSTPLSTLFTPSFDHHRRYPPKKHPPPQHSHLRSLGPLSITKKYMRFACGSLLSLLLMLLAQTSLGGSGDGVMHSGQVDDALRILSGALCLDGSGGAQPQQQNGTPTQQRYLYPLSTMIAAPAGATLAAPAPALAVGFLTLLWVWVLDDVAVLPRRWARGRAAVAGWKGVVCRCRVCTLRIQARGRPLHDVSVSAKKALSC